jgi:anti-sigma28 factor (negative regulator of flagellin synthesis)
MKINGSSPIGPVAPAAAEARAPERPSEPDASSGTRVSLSGDARWVAGVADEARNGPPVRADVVARTKAAVANGTWDSSVDYDQVIDRLVADL